MDLLFDFFSLFNHFLTLFGSSDIIQFIVIILFCDWLIYNVYYFWG